MERLITAKIGTPGYPARLASSKFIEPTATLWAYGQIEILTEPTIGLLCSSQCPGSIILKTFDAIIKIGTRAEFSWAVSTLQWNGSALEFCSVADSP